MCGLCSHHYAFCAIYDILSGLSIEGPCSRRARTCCVRKKAAGPLVGTVETTGLADPSVHAVGASETVSV